MGCNFEGNDSAPQKRENESADLTSQDFSSADQQAVLKSMQSDSSSVGQLDLDSSAHEADHARKDFPHNWFTNCKQSYALPAEAAFTNGMELSIKSGWNKLKN